MSELEAAKVAVHDLTCASAVERLRADKAEEKLETLRVALANLAVDWAIIASACADAGAAARSPAYADCADTLRALLRRGCAECACGEELKRYAGAGSTGELCPICDQEHAEELEVVP